MMKTEEKQPLWYWANVYKVSTSLFALLDAGVLGRLAERRMQATELSSELGLNRDALEAVLDLVVSVGVLDRDESGLCLGKSGAAVLPLLNLESRMAGRHINHANLSNVLRGRPPGDPMVSAEGAELWPEYLAAMNVGARSLAPHLVRFTRPSPGCRVVDLGGADGGLAYALSNMVPGIKVTVVDRPLVEKYFDGRRRERLKDGLPTLDVEFFPLDLRQPKPRVPTLANADLVIASNLLHLLGEAERSELLRNVREQLRPGAKLLVYDQFVGQKSTDSASCLVVDWLLCGYRFDFTEEAFAAQLNRAGFCNIDVRRMDGYPGAMVLAQVSEGSLQ